MFTDCGFRLSEIAGIKPADINWEQRTVKVWGKGSKERVGRFGDTTLHYLQRHLETYVPSGNVWGVNRAGIQTLLVRLRRNTGITTNSHSFRRAWAIEALKQGLNVIDVQLLGGWESLEMVKRYTREVDSEDAISRYKPLL